MKPSEEKVLEVLRKSTLAYLSEKQYKEIQAAVEKQGLIGLTGAARKIVSDAVVKHGSHDQSTHNPKKGGGGGGGGGGGASEKPEAGSEVLRENARAMAGQRKNLEEIATGKRGTARRQAFDPDDEYLRNGTRQVKSAASGLERAERKAVDGNSKGALQSLEGARQSLQVAKDEFEDQNYHDVVSALDKVQRNILTLEGGIKRNRGVSDNMTNPFGDD